jgi:mannose-6-phosphate isomerase-like protein (cupin superfamily)
MAGIQSADFDSPDETRTPEKTRVDVVRMGDATAARFTFEPGWKWSECVKPVAGTDSCQARHVGVVHSGRMHVVHEDGTEADVGPGEAYVIEPGHDAWVNGDETWSTIDFSQESADYAKPR